MRSAGTAATSAGLPPERESAAHPPAPRRSPARRAHQRRCGLDRPQLTETHELQRDTQIELRRGIAQRRKVSTARCGSGSSMTPARTTRRSRPGLERRQVLARRVSASSVNTSMSSTATPVRSRARLMSPIIGDSRSRRGHRQVTRRDDAKPRRIESARRRSFDVLDRCAPLTVRYASESQVADLQGFDPMR